MADDIEKVYTPETIDDMPFPLEGDVDLYVSQKTGNDIYEPARIQNKEFPKKRVATELLSSALNTRSKRIIQEFQFTQTGALQIGEYEEGVSGDVRISPSGIVARDSSGNTTFALDGETGSAVFKGTVQAGSLISGQVVVGNNTWVIDGDVNNPSIILYENDIPIIFLGEV